jgi:EAL domain-containing protein (putative c-di-GMP-specific phosphodiesterase class I)
LAEELSRAVEDDALDFHFQPIVDLQEMRVAGIETLARWNHPRRGLISPTEFIRTAEDIGFLEALDLCAMRAALRAHTHLQEALGDRKLYVSFNASFQTVSQERLVDQLIWAADAAEIPRDQIVVEVLESVLLGQDASADAVVRQVSGLKNAGFRAQLDDFGIGFAGLSHLAQLSVEGIKIDRSLIRTVETDATSDMIVRAVLALAKDLDLDVVAEGVEAPSIARHLVAQECRFVQGFGIARPMPLPRLVTWLQSFQPEAILRDDPPFRIQKASR